MVHLDPGAALGGLLGAVLPGAGEGTWALIGMAAAMAGVMRSPFTSIVFALELTHDVNALLALLVACTIAHLVSVLTLRAAVRHERVLHSPRPPHLPASRSLQADPHLKPHRVSGRPRRVDDTKLKATALPGSGPSRAARTRRLV